MSSAQDIRDKARTGIAVTLATAATGIAVLGQLAGIASDTLNNLALKVDDDKETRGGK